MTQQNQKLTAKTPISERRHSDPPGLWATVILSSLVIHLFVFGTLRLWLMLRLNSFLATQNLIPVDVIAVASEVTSPIQPTQTTASASIQNPPSANTPTKTPIQVPNSQTSSASVRTNSSQTGTQQGVNKGGASGTANQSPSVPRVPTVRKSPTTNPSQNQSGETPTQKPSPATNPSQNKPSDTQTPSTNPNSPTNQGNQSNGSTTSPSPSTDSTTGSGGGQNSSNREQGGIIISSTGEPDPIPNGNEVLHPNDPNYNDKLATLLEGSTQLSGDELKPLGITLDRDLEIKVEVLIDDKGNAKLLRIPPQGLPENLSSASAEQLVNKSIAKLKFSPTLMAGKPVYRDYTLTLRISPNQK